MDYEPIARLGRGGMGVVDLARDPQGNSVALKRLTLHGSASEVLQARQRLLREAKVLRRLHHPNIVRLLDVVEEDDELVLVMPYLPGGSLAERVAQHGPAPPPEVERLGQRLLGALAEAHAAGIVHRDLKPANVLYDANGEPQLADFGLAYTWDQSQALTMAGMVVGTPGFIAPEQARGEPLTPASDLFSLGATLLFAAIGRGPFGNGDPALLLARAAAGKLDRPPKQLPAPLRRRLEQMLDPRPERRPTAAALLAAGDAPVRRRLPGLAIAGGVAATVLVTTLVVATTRDSGDGRDAGVDDDVLGQDDDPSSSEGSGGSSGPDVPSDQASPARDPDDGRDLMGEIEGTIAPENDVDTYGLPLGPGAGPVSCPDQVVIELTPSGPATDQLALDVRQDGRLVGRELSDLDEPAVVSLDDLDCREQVEVEVRGAGTGGDQPYRLARSDSL